MENEVGDNTNKDLLKPKTMRAAEGEIKPCGVACPKEWSADGGQDGRGGCERRNASFQQVKLNTCRRLLFCRTSFFESCVLSRKGGFRCTACWEKEKVTVTGRGDWENLCPGMVLTGTALDG